MFISSSVLKDVGLYKERLASAFLNSVDICELMTGKEYDEDIAETLLYTQIFPYLYVDETQTSVKPYLCIEINIPKISSGTIKNINIIVWAYCHKKYMKYKKVGYLGTCADILADMAERQIRNSDKLGIGKPSLNSISYFFPNKNYYGKQLIFTASDFKVKG